MADAPPIEASNEPSILATGTASDADAGAVKRLLLFFALVYVVEGLGQIVGLISQPLNYYLKEVHGWNPLQVTAFITLFNLPWIIKPVYGLVSDFLPLFGYRRKSYLIIANIAATVGYLWVTQLNAPGDLALALMLTAYAMAISSTLCGAVLVENGQRKQSDGDGEPITDRDAPQKNTRAEDGADRSTVRAFHEPLHSPVSSLASKHGGGDQHE